jgi:hypothetical protein
VVSEGPSLCLVTFSFRVVFQSMSRVLSVKDTVEQLGCWLPDKFPVSLCATGGLPSIHLQGVCRKFITPLVNLCLLTFGSRKTEGVQKHFD